MSARTPSPPPQGDADQAKVASNSEFSWRPIQRSTRFVVFIALGVTLFYAIFLLNPRYRGNIWVWLLVLFAEGITVFNALAMWWTVLVYTPHPDTPEVYAWRRRLAGASRCQRRHRQLEHERPAGAVPGFAGARETYGGSGDRRRR